MKVFSKVFIKKIQTTESKLIRSYNCANTFTTTSKLQGVFVALKFNFCNRDIQLSRERSNLPPMDMKYDVI